MKESQAIIKCCRRIQGPQTNKQSEGGQGWKIYVSVCGGCWDALSDSPDIFASRSAITASSGRQHPPPPAPGSGSRLPLPLALTIGHMDGHVKVQPLIPTWDNSEGPSQVEGTLETTPQPSCSAHVLRLPLLSFRRH